MKMYRIAALCAFAAAAASLHAQSGLADPRSLWDFAENPAAWAFSGDIMAAGARTSVDMTAIDRFDLQNQGYEVAFGLPGMLYRYTENEGLTENALALSVSLGRSLACGWQYRGASFDSPDRKHDLGMLLRPNGFLSLGLKLTDIASAEPSYSLGLSMRPLAFVSRNAAPYMTLGATAAWEAGQFALKQAGVRADLNGILQLDARYDFALGGIGVGMRLAFGPSETGMRVERIDEPGILDLGSAFRIASYPALPPAGKRAAVAALALDGQDIRTPGWHDAAVAAILRAAADPRIGALVLTDPPEPASDAHAQELCRAIRRFQAAGKKVYAYARNAGRKSYQYLISSADLFALDPNGALALLDAGGSTLYYRGFLDKIGVRFYTLRSHDTKTAFNNLTEYGMTDAERTMRGRFVGAIARQGYEALDLARRERMNADGRDIMAGGPYLVPTAALDAGLADGIMYRDEFDELVREQGIRILMSLSEYGSMADGSWGDHPLSRIVAVVHLSGSIINGPGTAGLTIGETAAERLRELREDPFVAGIILRIDSGGGDAGTSDLIAREVERTVKSGKPVFVSMAGYAASGGYYIAAPADRIWAEAGTITGSIGVTGVAPDATGLIGKLGIRADSVAASPSADFSNPLLPHRESDAERQAEAISYIYGRFMDVVARGRSMDAGNVDELGRGQVWTGAEALENGLVDELGGLAETVQAMSARLGGPVRLRDERPGLVRGFDPFSMLLSRMAMPPLSEALNRFALMASELEALGTGPLCIYPDYLWRERE